MRKQTTLSWEGMIEAFNKLGKQVEITNNLKVIGKILKNFAYFFTIMVVKVFSSQSVQ